MAYITVTNTLVNGNTADAGELNTNFTDIINGTSDGSKDLNVAALTCAGNVTFNANTAIGNATSDTVTFTARAASDFLPSADDTYDLGSSSLKWSEVRSTSTYANYLLESTSGNGTLIKGKSDGSSISSSYVGEYVSAECSTSSAQTNNDTWYDVTGASITLTAGVWMIGYGACIAMGWVSGTNQVAANVAITDSSNNLIDKTVSQVGGYLASSGDNKTFSTSRSTIINISSTTSYKLRVRCTVANSVATATVYNDSTTGTLTNPDNETVIWAVRIA